MREGKFIGVPKEILYNGEEDSLIKKYNDPYLVATFYGIRIGVRFDYCVFTLESLLVSIGIANNKKNIPLIKKSLKILNNEKIILIKKDIEKLTKTEPFKIIIYKTETFFKLYLKAYDIMVVDSNDRQDSKIKLLNTYSYLQSRMYNNKKGEHATKDGKYHVAFPSLDIIQENTLTSRRTVIDKIDKLVNLDLIRYMNSGNYKKGGKYAKGLNVYTNYSDNWEDDVKGSIKQFRKKKIEDGYQFTGDITNKGKTIKNLK